MDLSSMTSSVISMANLPNMSSISDIAGMANLSNVTNMIPVQMLSLSEIESIIGMSVTFDPSDIISKLGKDIDTSIPDETSGSGSVLEELQELASFDTEEIEEDLAQQIQIAKDNFNAMIKPVKDKIEEYKQVIEDKLGEWNDKINAVVVGSTRTNIDGQAIYKARMKEIDIFDEDEFFIWCDLDSDLANLQ